MRRGVADTYVAKVEWREEEGGGGSYGPMDVCRGLDQIGSMCVCVWVRYDAGDTIKMVHTMGYSASVLLWGITVPTGFTHIYSI